MVFVRGLAFTSIAALNICVPSPASVLALIAKSLQAGRLVRCRSIALQLSGRVAMNLYDPPATGKSRCRPVEAWWKQEGENCCVIPTIPANIATGLVHRNWLK